MAVVIDGKKLSKKIIEELKIECDILKANGITPKLAVVMVGNNQASKVYIKNKSRICEEIGIEYEEYIFDDNITQEELDNTIKELNNKEDINGILLQSPIPEHLNITKSFKTISYKKDIDGFTPSSIGKLTIGEDTFIACTPYGVIKIFEEYDIDLTGKDVVIIGRSNVVGKPLAQCCLNKNATVTICHSKTKNLKEHTKRADILIATLGKAKFVTKDMVKKGAVVIDVGINMDENGKIIGDVDYKNVEQIASYITPVPGGIGPMTIAMLMNNIIKAAKEQNK